MYYLICSSKRLHGTGIIILILQNRKRKLLPQVLELRTKPGAEFGTAGSQSLVPSALCVSPSTLLARLILKTQTVSRISVRTSMDGIIRN